MQGKRPFRIRSSERVHGDVRGNRSSAWDSVYAIARGIPRGRVMTYGQISGLLAGDLSPRAVGWALHRSPEGVPWQRVVNASGGCSTDRLPDVPAGLQRAMLEAEGVRFSGAGKLDLERFRWNPPAPGRKKAGKARSQLPVPSRRRSQRT